MLPIKPASPIPLPDVEAIDRCIIRRALSSDQDSWPPSLRSRVLQLADEAKAVNLNTLVLSWPDSHHCIAIVPWADPGHLPSLERTVILAAYRHALRDPHAQELFYPLGNICGGGR